MSEEKLTKVDINWYPGHMAKTKRLINSFKFAYEGILVSLKEEQNFKIHVLIMLLVIIMGLVNFVHSVL